MLTESQIKEIIESVETALPVPPHLLKPYRIKHAPSLPKVGLYNLNRRHFNIIIFSRIFYEHPLNTSDFSSISHILLDFLIEFDYNASSLKFFIKSTVLKRLIK